MNRPRSAWVQSPLNCRQSMRYGAAMARAVFQRESVVVTNAAHALHIKSTEWAKLGMPLGLVIMAGTAALLWVGVI